MDTTTYGAIWPLYNQLCQRGRSPFKPCIFCREDAAQSRSREHIFPESLGNTEHVLPPGVVCDRCNNYFARKIEGPLLDIEYFRHARATMQVANKRKRVPPQFGVIPQLRMAADVWMDGQSIAIQPKNRSRTGDFEQYLMNKKGGSLWLPHPTRLDDRLMSRFLGKVAIEALAKRVSGIEGWREEMLSQEAMEPLRRYVRIGDQCETWRFNRRRLYTSDQVFGLDGTGYEILHEYDFLYTQDCELIFVMALFGEEFAFNMGGSETERYQEYLMDNNGTSLLAPWHQ